MIFYDRTNKVTFGEKEHSAQYKICNSEAWWCGKNITLRDCYYAVGTGKLTRIRGKRIRNSINLFFPKEYLLSSILIRLDRQSNFQQDSIHWKPPQNGFRRIWLAYTNVSSVTIIDAERSIFKPCSNSILASRIHFHTTTLKKDMNPFYLLPNMG